MEAPRRAARAEAYPARLRARAGWFQHFGPRAAPFKDPRRLLDSGQHALPFGETFDQSRRLLDTHRHRREVHELQVLAYQPVDITVGNIKHRQLSFCSLSRIK
ncbi:hypothetical protein SDC9_116419 [bioreactor metagenome]|uniref:Uncharacterized protein n=1 Tax=bioreactor metagenome TaxID=1076179 RepID=A0A645C695_9ZZZZ